MIIEIKVPSPGESISEVQLASWLVSNGAFVERDTDIAEIDSDKATLTINAPESGVISIEVQAGESVEVGAVIARIDTSAVPEKGSKPKENTKTENNTKEEKPEQKPVEAEPIHEKAKPADSKTSGAEKSSLPENIQVNISPLARKLMQENKLEADEVANHFLNLRISKSDVEEYIGARKSSPAKESSTVKPGSRDVERKKMSTLRLKLAKRLVAVKQETAMLTTFNEVNMSKVMAMRDKYGPALKEKYGFSFGFVTFFVKAVAEALKHFPQVNGMIDGDEMVYHKYVDIGIAVSAPKGLVVPVIRNAESLTLDQIEKNIKELAAKARDNKITLEEMTGGTFTITNGGVFGSMLSTPILNPPQSAILGMHNIVERPVAVNGKVEIHPIMYVALSYDHRVIDGRESVGFLVKVKEMIEDPVKMLFEGNDPEKQLLNL
ncbi:MAG: 2-oxoglutarate dehydrogenase complex dihydrolipoyllysine-residue succinyltransferase [Bacteroidales bacterium]|nr:2-oxoglutarate dehydrogenase complex dihydrolipoyllysine-residue succinyltransferase [Bacteroidales bacterium]